mgnify:CR=1 FL=1
MSDENEKEKDGELKYLSRIRRYLIEIIILCSIVLGQEATLIKGAEALNRAGMALRGSYVCLTSGDCQTGSKQHAAASPVGLVCPIEAEGNQLRFMDDGTVQ